MENNITLIIIMGILGILLSILMIGAVLALPYFFIRMILKQIEYGKVIKMWGLDLKKRYTTQVEFHPCYEIYNR